MTVQPLVIGGYEKDRAFFDNRSAMNYGRGENAVFTAGVADVGAIVKRDNPSVFSPAAKIHLPLHKGDTPPAVANGGSKPRPTTLG